MRRIAPVFLSLSCLYFASACTEPPKPDADKDKKSEEQGDTDDKPAKTKKGDLPALPTGAVAIINGKEITAADFHGIYDLKLQKYKDRDREIPKTADRRYRKSITDRLIYQEVLRQEAAEVGVEYDAEKLKSREDAQRKGITDWERHLRRRGESDESLREMYTAELREIALLEQRGKLEVTDEDIDAEYEKIKPNYKKDKERVRAAHILVRIGPKDRPPRPHTGDDAPSDEEQKQWEKEALARAEEIHGRATAEGTDFKELAKEASDGPSARKGGDLGIFSADRMVAEFSKAAFALKPGEVSKPIKTKFGYHIIKSYGKYPPGDLPKEALEDQIRDRLSSRKLHQGRRELKEGLLAKHKVENVMEKHLGPDPRKKKRDKERDRKSFKGPHNGDSPAGAGKDEKRAKMRERLGEAHGHDHDDGHDHGEGKKSAGEDGEGKNGKKGDGKKGEGKKGKGKKGDGEKSSGKKSEGKKGEGKKSDG